MVAAEPARCPMFRTCFVEESDHSRSAVVVHNLHAGDVAREPINKSMYDKFVANESCKTMSDDYRDLMFGPSLHTKLPVMMP
jgi:hypothetical protein